MKVTVEAPEVRVEFDTAAKPSVLGRSPPDQVEGELVTRVFIASEQVSRTHALLRDEGDRVVVRALSARGTWLRVPQRGEVTVTGATSVELRLSDAVGRDGPLPPILDAREDEERTYEEAVVERLREWFSTLNLQVDLERSPRDVPTSDAGTLPLGDAARLALRPNPASTRTVRWDSVKRYVHDWLSSQNLSYQSRRSGCHPHDFVLASEPLQRAHEMVWTAVRLRLNALVLGPEGSGRRELSRCYAFSHLGPSETRTGCVEVDCASASEPSLRARLASAVRPSNQPWTLLLHDVASLAPSAQALLLSYLDTGVIDGEPGTSPLFRRLPLVCATGPSDLGERVDRGRFREDLYYRLAGRVARLPPLRDRPADVRAYLRSAPHTARLRAESLERLLAYPWPGNFAELTAFVRRLRPERSSADAPIDAEGCLALLAEGFTRAPPAPALRPAPDGEEPSWSTVALRAAKSFEREQGEAFPLPERFASKSTERSFQKIVEGFVERHLKPEYVATLLGPDGVASAKQRCTDRLARGIGLSEGSVLKKYLPPDDQT